MRENGVPEKYIRLVKVMYHQCETVVRGAAGTTEPFAVEVGLHQGSAFSPFLFAITMDSLTEHIRKKSSRHMMFEDDVVLCARKTDVLEMELLQCREALEKRGMKVPRAKTEYMTKWNVIKKYYICNLPSCHRSPNLKHPAGRW